MIKKISGPKATGDRQGDKKGNTKESVALKMADGRIFRQHDKSPSNYI
jgi:hypothetical protein